MLLLASALTLVLGACGGGGGAPDPTVGGSPTTAGGSSPTTTGDTSGPETTQRAPSGGDDGTLVVELDGNRYEFTVREDIEYPGVAGTNLPTRCQTDFFGTGMFWIIAFMTDDAGVLVDDHQVSLGLYADGAVDEDHDDIMIVSDGELVQYMVDKDEPGSWTISGDRIHGQLNLIFFGSAGTEEATTATFDITCPADRTLK